MKKLALLFFLLVQGAGLFAQTYRITYMSVKRETDLPYYDPVQNIHAGTIKLAVPGMHFVIDTAGTGLNPPKVRFLVPKAFPSSLVAWQNRYQAFSAAPYQTIDDDSTRPIITKIRAIHSDTLLIDFNSWTMQGSQRMLHGAPFSFSGYFDLEVRKVDWIAVKDSGFHFNGTRDAALYQAANLDASKITVVGAKGHCGQTVDIDIFGQNTHFGPAPAALAAQGLGPNQVIANVFDSPWINTLNAVTVLSPTHMVANITIVPGSDFGKKDLTILTPNDGILHINNGFEVLRENQQQLSHLLGFVYNDANQNCQRDANEKGIPGVVVWTVPGGDMAITDTAGHYHIEVITTNWGMRLKRRSLPGWTATCPVGASDPFDMYGAEQNYRIDTIHFGDYQAIPNAGRDLSIEAASSLARPGRSLRYSAYVLNQGDSARTTTLRFVPDAILLNVTAVPAPDEVRGDTLVWNLSLAANGNRRFDIKSEVNVNLSTLGSFVESHFSLSPNIPDANPANNQETVRSEIIASFDPNDKIVEPAGNLQPRDSILTYTIRFQNTGNDTAFSVAVRDTLSANLDIASIKTLIASHPYTFSLKGARNAEWRFDNILLPDSNKNEERSHGLVKFSIVRKKNMTIGSAITNTAHIYFDFNKGVATNLVRSTIAGPTETPKVLKQATGALVIPNPLHGKGRLLLLGNAAQGHGILTVKDALGKTIYTEKGLIGKEFPFGDSMKTGVYFLLVSEYGKTLAQGRFAVD